ncbi:MAG: nuclear transport factor 2 family protein [Hyphomicrobiales bacterium]
MEVTEKLKIHELLGRAAYAFDERDIEMLERCFAPEATMLVTIVDGQTFGPFDGREAIMGLMKATLDSQTDMRRHTISNFIFEEEGDDRARVLSTVVVTSAENGEIKLVTSGVYDDVVTRTDDGWQIADRKLKLELGF